MGIHQTGIQTQSVFFDTYEKAPVKGKVFNCPTGARPWRSDGGRASAFCKGSPPNTYACSPYGCHNIMHPIIGVPISLSASLFMGHVENRVTRK